MKRSTWVLVGVIIALATAVGGSRLLVAGGDAEPTDEVSTARPTPVEPTKARVSVPSTLQEGTRFSVVYEPTDGAESKQLSPDIRLMLWDDQTVRHALVASRPPRIQPPDDPIPLSQLMGGGPYEFQLPRLEPGTYMLCGAIGRIDDDQLEKWCRNVDVSPQRE